MVIQCFPHPTTASVHAVRELERVCQTHDQLKGSLFLDPSLNFSPEAPCLLACYEEETLLGAMTFFAPTQEEAELVALTLPSFRRHGVFRALLHEAANQASALGIPDFLFVCEPQSKDGTAALASFPHAPDHTEYALRYDQTKSPDTLAVPAGLSLHRATEADLAVMSQISSESFSEEAERAAHFLALAKLADDVGINQIHRQLCRPARAQSQNPGQRRGSALGLQRKTFFGVSARPVPESYGVLLLR